MTTTKRRIHPLVQASIAYGVMVFAIGFMIGLIA